jgi:hypothetical protein
MIYSREQMMIQRQYAMTAANQSHVFLVDPVVTFQAQSPSQPHMKLPNQEVATGRSDKQRRPGVKTLQL